MHPKCSFDISNVSHVPQRLSHVNKRTSITTRLFCTATKSTRTLFEDFSRKNNINFEDWYEIDRNALDENTSQVLKKEFNGSLYGALSTLFPEKEWIPWRFQQRVPVGFWNSTQNQRKYFDWLGKKLGIKKLDDWYKKLSIDILKQNAGNGLVTFNKGSARVALMTAYPEHNWNITKFKSERRGLWASLEAQRDFFDKVGKSLGITHFDEWYEKLSVDILKQCGGQGLLALKQPPASILMNVYPEHNWMPWKFKLEQVGLWSSQKTQRKYFDWLGKQLRVQHLDDWYQKLSGSVIRANEGAGLLLYFNGSPFAALWSAYPEHRWEAWKFTNAPSNFWKSSSNVKDYLAELSKKLSIQTLDDWYRVDWEQLKIFGASQVLKRYKGLYNVLKEQYPHHPWDPRRLKQTSKKAQRWLLITVQNMFPNEEIIEDYLHPKVKVFPSNRPMQLDVFIPSKNLAFEYQGKQHYEEVGIFNPTRTYQQRDEEKRILCAANNIKLIEVPYWWNRTQEQLQEIMADA